MAVNDDYKKRVMYGSGMPQQPGQPSQDKPASPYNPPSYAPRPPSEQIDPNGPQYQMVSDYVTPSEAAMIDYEKGASIGRREFIDDPEMQKLKALREDYAKGYSGQELGNIRQSARGEIAGAQQTQQRALQSRLGRGGVGGARGAAIMGQQGLQGQKAISEAERGMALDSVNMQRTVAKDLEDFIFKQKAGVAGYGAGIAKMASAERTAKASADAAGGGGGCCGMIALVTALSGVNKAEAAKIVSMTKGTSVQRAAVVEQYAHNPQVISMIEDLNSIRFVRDNYCSAKELRGYYKFSETVAPMIQDRPVLAKIGQIVMVEPIKAVKSEKMTLKKLAGLAWIKAWGFMGSDKPFQRSNGEVV